MFTSLGLFKQITCVAPKCSRINCPFSHIPVKALQLPADDLKSLAGSDLTIQPTAVIGKRLPSPTFVPTRPTKVPRIERTVASTSTSNFGSASYSTTSISTHGPPKLLVDPSQSKIPYAARQTMINTLYGVFKDLYHKFHEIHPELAQVDALAQESEVYAKTNKQAYKNVMSSRSTGLF